jgi:glyoxylase-like metal-dependent hydrolase (beta-lactamase superfamily II)
MAMIKGIHLLDISTPFAVGKANCYFVEGHVPTLIDTPPRGMIHVDELEVALKRIGYSVRDIARIIITHHHFDHFGAASDLVRMNGAAVFASRGAAGYLEHFEDELEKDRDRYLKMLVQAGVPGDANNYLDALFAWAFSYGSSVPVSQMLDDGDELDLGPGPCRIAAVPGHTPWCILVYSQDRTFAFSGDFLLKQTSPEALIQQPAAKPGLYRSPKACLTSLHRVRQLGIQTVLPGHGKAIRDVAVRIDEINGFIAERKGFVHNILAKGRCTPFSIAEQTFSSLEEELVFFGILEVLGYLELLESEGLAEQDGGLWSVR